MDLVEAAITRRVDFKVFRHLDYQPTNIQTSPSQASNPIPLTSYATGIMQASPSPQNIYLEVN